MKNKTDATTKARRYAVEAAAHLQKMALRIAEIAQLNQLIHIGRQTLLDAPHLFFTWLLLILLSADAVFSAPLILLATAEGQKLEGPFWESVFFILYFFTVGGITTLAADYLARGSSERHRHFYLHVRKLARPGKSAAELEMEYAQDARQKKRVAIVLLVALSAFLIVLGAFRVYVVNGREWNFRIIDILHFLPLGLALFLVVLGKYKFIVMKTWRWSAKRKRLIRQYRQCRTVADTHILVVIDVLQSGGIPLDAADLPAEIKTCIQHYLGNNPLELAELGLSNENALPFRNFN